jgi:hypothetical protein
VVKPLFHNTVILQFAAEIVPTIYIPGVVDGQGLFFLHATESTVTKKIITQRSG